MVLKHFKDGNFVEEAFFVKDFCLIFYIRLKMKGNDKKRRKEGFNGN